MHHACARESQNGRLFINMILLKCRLDKFPRPNIYCLWNWVNGFKRRIVNINVLTHLVGNWVGLILVLAIPLSARFSLGWWEFGRKGWVAGQDGCNIQIKFNPTQFPDTDLYCQTTEFPIPSCVDIFPLSFRELRHRGFWDPNTTQKIIINTRWNKTWRNLTNDGMGNSVKIRCFPIFHFFASPYFRNGGLLINSSSWGRTLIVSLPLQDSPTKKLSLPDHVVMTKSVGSAPNSPVTAKRHSSWTTTDGGGNAQTVDRWDTGWGGHLFRRFRNMFSKSSSCLHGSCSTAQQPWGFPAHNTWLYSASLLQGLQLKLKNNHTSGAHRTGRGRKMDFGYQ